ncbi:MAG: hypothetical protein HOV79_12695 [Hamadaea sp.]|nr:hypothetical protein [Hamadaea sp.]
MTGMGIRDDQFAGLRLFLPRAWKVETEDLLGPFTMVVSKPEPDPNDPEQLARAAAEEARLWRIAVDVDADYSDDPLDDLGEGSEHVSVATGTLQNLAEAPVEVPDVDPPYDSEPSDEELFEVAEDLATTYGALLDFYPERSVRSEQVTRRVLDLDGRIAASYSHTYSAGVNGEETGHLHLVVVHLAEGRLSFALGVAKPDRDRTLIDDIIDSVRPLP